MLCQELDLLPTFWDSGTRRCCNYGGDAGTGQVFDFLVGLWSNFDKVQGRVLGIEPIPCLNDVFTYVIVEEGRKNVMMDNGSQDVLTLKIKYQDNQKVWQ